MEVGSSNRTLGKHALLNKILGRECGVYALKKPKFIFNGYTIIDMCAGDGKPTEGSQTSSPLIIEKHKTFVEKKHMKITTFLFEKNENTYAILKSKFKNTYNKDSSKLQEIPGNPHPNTACFIHADPNNITDWPISEKLLLAAPKYTTMLITLGCNVGGLKRLKIEERKKWFTKMDTVLEFLPSWHDALLISLNGDNAQWAYLITGPKKWHDNGVYKKDAIHSFKYWKYGIEMVQFQTNKNDFMDKRNQLFLTKGEIKCQ